MTETQEKRLFALVLILVVVVGLLAGFAVYTSYTKPASTFVASPLTSEQKAISVSGTGVVSMTPDIGWFTASVVTQAATAAQAEQQNNDAMSKVISALRQAGIADKDIQTVAFSLTPTYQDSKDPTRPPVLVGYSATQSISVTVRDVSAIGKMLDLAISSGANQMGGIYFGLSDAKAQQAQSQALDLAVKDANSKAQAIAKSAGVTLVGPISINLGSSYQPVRVGLSEAAAQPAPIMPGQLQYTVNVQINYAFN
jgi:uncharacterized protein YggE